MTDQPVLQDGNAAVRDALKAIDAILELENLPSKIWHALRNLKVFLSTPAAGVTGTKPAPDAMRDELLKAKAAVAYLIEHIEYSDSYGVEGSSFMACRLCTGGGAPSVRLVHDATCPVRRCEAVAGEWVAELNDEREVSPAPVPSGDGIKRQAYVDPDFDQAGNRRYWEQKQAAPFDAGAAEPDVQKESAAQYRKAVDDANRMNDKGEVPPVRGDRETVAKLRTLVENASQMAYERAPLDFHNFGEPPYIDEARKVINSLSLPFAPTQKGPYDGRT